MSTHIINFKKFYLLYNFVVELKSQNVQINIDNAIQEEKVAACEPDEFIIANIIKKLCEDSKIN